MQKYATGHNKHGIYDMLCSSKLPNLNCSEEKVNWIFTKVDLKVYHTSHIPDR